MIWRSFTNLSTNASLKSSKICSIFLQPPYRNSVFSYSSKFNTFHNFIYKQNPSKLNFKEVCISRKIKQFSESSLIKRLNKNFNILSLCFSKYCKFLTIQKLKQSLNLISFYNNFYDKKGVVEMIKIFRHNYSQCRRKIPLALLSFTTFSWERDKISDEDMQECSNEIELISNFISNKKAQNTPGACIVSDWEKVIDRDNLIVWRKPVPDTYLYEYKVYGTFKDIPPRAFFNVQLDLQYRKQWDKLVVELDVVDRSPFSDMEVVRWITHYPYPMYSREYVYIRKFKIDKASGIITLMSRSVDHPRCPVSDKYVRVQTYKSHMAIRPHAGIDDNGFDYVLTYSDDPQAAFPSFAYNWMASTGVPEFVNTLHRAAFALHNQPSKRSYDSCSDLEYTEGETEKLSM